MQASEIIQGQYAGHLVTGRDVTPASLERQRRVYRARYGGFLPLDRQAPVLELGCGYGAFLYFLQREGYTSVEGIDTDAALVEMTRRFGISGVQRAEAGAYLAGRTESYECIVALDVIEHLPKEQAVPLLAVVRQALRPGGTFILHAPCASGPFGARYRYEDLTHTLAFTARSVRQALAAAGFGEAQVHPTRPVVNGVRGLVRAGLWRGIEAGLTAMQLIETGSARDLVVTQNLIAVSWRPR